MVNNMTDKMFNWYVYDRNTIINRINSMRGKRGSDAYISNDTLSKHLGYSETQVQKWFSKKESVAIPLNCLMEMANLFNCDIDYLLGRIDLPTKEATDIHKETGLSEEAITILREKEQKLNYLGEPLGLVIDFLIKDSVERPSLMRSAIECIWKKQSYSNSGDSASFRKLKEAIENYYMGHEGDFIVGNTFDALLIEEGLLDFLRNHLSEEKYSAKEIDDIKEASEYYGDYIHYLSTQEISKAIMYNLTTRYIDKYLF